MPRFSIVCVGPNASVEAQTFPRDRVELVVIDDVSSRNAALRKISGEWVTFLGPDQAIGPGYLTAVDEFLTRRPDVAAVATRPIVFREPSRMSERHPWDRLFPDEDRVVDLAEYADV